MSMKVTGESEATKSYVSVDVETTSNITWYITYYILLCITYFMVLQCVIIHIFICIVMLYCIFNTVWEIESNSVRPVKYNF